MDIGETKAFLNIEYRFRSGNTVPISKAHVPKEDWDKLKDEINRHLVCLAICDVPIADLKEGMRVISATKALIGRITAIRYSALRQCRDDEFDIEWSTGRLSTAFHMNSNKIWLIPGTPDIDHKLGEDNAKGAVDQLLKDVGQQP